MALYFYALASLLLPHVALAVTERLSFIDTLAGTLLPLGVYMWLLARGRRPGRMVWWLFLLVFFAAFQMVLLGLFGSGIISVDMFLNLVTTNPGEVGELLGNLLPAVVGVLVIYVPLLVWAGIAWWRGTRVVGPVIGVCGRWAALPAALGVVCLFVASMADSGYRMRDRFYPVNVCYNLCLAVERSYVSSHYEERTASFRFHAASAHPSDTAEVYIMVIGETARAHDFALYGYQRPTTPLLGSLEGVTAFSQATTQSNTTHKSVPMLLSAATAQDFERLYRERGIMEAFREAGFHTAFFSNQLPNHSFIDFLGKQADESDFIKTHAGMENAPDDDLLKRVERVLSQGRHREFIVLHTYGSHFNYRERYPRSMAHFLPDDRMEAKAENRDQLLNAYDNTIRYTDSLLYALTRMVERPGTHAALLYASDHGENIFDDGRGLFLHASPHASWYELHVPFIVWLSDGYRRAYPLIQAALEAHRDIAVETSVSAFHTMLQIGGISMPAFDSTRSLASRSYRPRPRRYLTDRNEAVPLKK